MLPECNRVSNVSILGRVNSVSVVRIVSQAYRDLEEEIHREESVDLCVAKFLEGRQYPLADVDSA